MIPEVSVTADPGFDETDGQLFQLSRYTGAVLPADCLPEGSYRVELYVNGRLAAEASTTTDFGDLDAFMARDLTMAFCHPSDWVRREDRLPGLIDGFQSATAPMASTAPDTASPEACARSTISPRRSRS